jgi:diaminopimelate epimerase
VENETLACGTGATAAAIASFISDKVDASVIKVQVLGGLLTVRFTKQGDKFTNVWLKGPAVGVYSGKILNHG